MKNQLVKKQEMLINIVAPGAEMDSAARINHFHKISMQAGEVAIKAALEVGMSLFQEKIRRQGTFQAWVEQNCDFSQRTAYNYLSLLQKSIGAQTDLLQLADVSAKKRESTISEFAATVESKTLSDLMCDFGIITKSKSNLGGKREGAGRKPKEDASSAAGAAEAAENAGFAAQNAYEHANEVYVQGVIKQGFEAMETVQLKAVCKLLASVVEEAKKILKAKAQ